MASITKIAISLNHNKLSIELAFNILQRKVFADNKLDIYFLTSDVDLVRNMAVHISKCCFFNLNELNVTGDCHAAFKNADYLLLMTSNTNAAREDKVVDNIQDFQRFVEKAKIFDQLAKSNARVLIMGSQSQIWLQVFAEVATNLFMHNLTGLSRHNVSKALSLISRKLNCEPQELSDVFIRGKNCLDLISAKKRTKCNSEKCSSLCERKTQSVMELLPLDWIDSCLTPEFERIQNKTNRHCLVSAVCFHLKDLCRGTDNRMVCMETTVQWPGHISDQVYSSYPVVVDQDGNIPVVQNIKTESSLFVKLNRFYEHLQKERYRNRIFLNTMTETPDD